MGVTSPDSLPWPVGTAVPDGPLAFQNLATATQTALTAIRAADTAAIADSGWINATMGTGWTNAAGYTTRYRRRYGRVEVTGMVVRGSGAGNAFFTLPAGYVPSQTVILASFLTSDGVGYDLFASTTGAVGFASSGYNTGSTVIGTNHPVGGSFLL